MNHTLMTTARYGLLNPEAVRTYLIEHGWRQETYPGPELLVFSGPEDDDGRPIVQVLPSSVHLRDYQMRLEELIKALSVLENRSPDDIIKDMMPPGASANQNPMPSTGSSLISPSRPIA
jgi:hypothetical protein